MTVAVAAGKTVTYGVGVSTPAAAGSCEWCTIRDVLVNVQGTCTAAFALGPDWPTATTVDVANTTLDHCYYNGSPTYGYLAGNGVGGNVLQNTAYSCGGTTAQYGVNIAGGGLNFYGGGFTANSVADILVTCPPGQMMVFENFRGEGGKRFFSMGGVGPHQGVSLTNCWAAAYTPADNIMVSHAATGPLYLTDCFFEGGTATTIQMNPSGAPGGHVTSLTAVNVTLGNTTTGGWPALNLASYYRTIIAASYLTAAYGTGYTIANLLFQRVIDGAGPDVQAFTAAGTWTKPSGAKTVIVTAIEAGSGGGVGSPRRRPHHPLRRRRRCGRCRSATAVRRYRPACDRRGYGRCRRCGRPGGDGERHERQQRCGKD